MNHFKLGKHKTLFMILVLTNLFVGGMVGLERTLLPLIAQADFTLSSSVAVLSFIATFGVTIVAFVTGIIANNYGFRPEPFYVGFVLTLLAFYAIITYNRH